LPTFAFGSGIKAAVVATVVMELSKGSE